MKRNVFAGVLSVLLLVSCKGGSNKDKPIIFFNRQPSDTQTGEIDQSTMNYTDKTFYVGFDAAAGGDVQGKMITDYLATKTKAELDKNGDGVLGYVLAIGDQAHNDSKARTLGIRKALKTVKNNSTNSGADQTIEGEVTVKDGKLKVKELASQAMSGADGSTWNAEAATTAYTTWAGQYKNAIDMAVSNNDGMAEGMKSSTAWVEGTLLFGYDANADVLQDIKKGKMTGTVTQNVDAQAFGVLEMVRNLVDGSSVTDAYTKGFSEKDQYGNQISVPMAYKSDTKALLASNSAITSENIDKFYNEKETPRDAGVKALPDTAKTIKLWIDLYNGGDTFLSTSYKPALEYYAKLLKIEMKMVMGDGQSEDAVVSNLNNLGAYDAYAINMVKTNSGKLYTQKIK